MFNRFDNRCDVYKIIHILITENTYSFTCDVDGSNVAMEIRDTAVQVTHIIRDSAIFFGNFIFRMYGNGRVVTIERTLDYNAWDNYLV